MPNGAKELSHQQRQAIVHLLAERDVPSAAQAAGIGERTLWRWLADPLFCAELGAAESAAIDFAVRRLITVSEKAINTLETVLDDATASKGVRVRAAVAVLDQVIKLRELRNLEARLTALERAYAAKL